MLEMLNVARMASYGLRHAGSALGLAGILLLTACGGSEAPGTSSGSGGGGTTPAASSLELKLVDSGGASVIQLAAGQSVQAQATLKRGNTPVANEIVTFSVEAGALATLSPAGGTVLTDSNGVARIGLVASTTQAGATPVVHLCTAGAGPARRCGAGKTATVDREECLEVVCPFRWHRDTEQKWHFSGGASPCAAPDASHQLTNNERSAK